MMNAGIAIVGMACCYPDARNPQQLWENVLARRRAFRRIPAERLCLSDYLAEDPAAPDALYSAEAALIEGYEFDRVRFRVSGPIFRSVDLAHWLALDVADQAFRDSGIDRIGPLPWETTGVLLGNTLTGEFSRAATLRLRWPYVRRLLDAKLREEQWNEQERRRFLHQVEEDFKAPFAPVGEETLAGALSNTIAGRICNYFHLGGGGYTLDGACCSSLLAVARACSALEAGELDAALAGGVDLSLDPFELVGFAKAGALARNEMRVYDRQSNGFLPGEGAGFVVLMRHEDAIADNRRIYALIRGWGISSDGSGSITRPEKRGQMLALERAYRRAGYGPETVLLFEGHGTGTPVGDEVELQSLQAARSVSAVQGRPAAVGSIKANFGHTKAAAGIAGLIKATLAVDRQVLPPNTGVVHPRPELQGEGAVLRILSEAELWPADAPLRAGVNSFGFGGINVHVTVESQAPRRSSFTPREHLLMASAQDAELFLLEAESNFALAARADALADEARGWSCSDVADASAALAGRLVGARWRAAIVARTPLELSQRLETLARLLGHGTNRHLDFEAGLFFGIADQAPRIGFLFPGQASPVRFSPAIFGKRFALIAHLYDCAALEERADSASTDVAQPAIVVAELAGLRLLQALGIEASVGLGHSLGELCAYHWAGALDHDSLLSLVKTRGRLMADVPGPAGAMAGISAPISETLKIIAGEDVALACLNAPDQNVVSGEARAVGRVVERASDNGWSATLLSAGHAFHSPLMAPAAAQFRNAVNALDFAPLQRRLISTISGSELSSTADLRQLLVSQLTEPVRFAQAAAQITSEVDLLIEVGPGHVLTNLSRPSGCAAAALDVAGASLRGTLEAVAAAFALGASVRPQVLFDRRFTRDFDLDRKQTFFVNPCELAPAYEGGERERSESSITAVPDSHEHERVAVATEIAADASGAIQVVRELLAKRTELPESAIDENARLLRDLHLNSIVVAEIVAAAARKLNTTPPVRPLKFADATVGELAHALQQLRATSAEASPEREAVPAGVSHWTRAFVPEWRRMERAAQTDVLNGAGGWTVFASDRNADARSRAENLPGNGVIVFLDDIPVEEQFELLLEGAHAALSSEHKELCFVIAGPGASVTAAFARTLQLEHPHMLTRVIETSLNGDFRTRICQELASTQAHVHVRYDAAGDRWEPNFKLLAQFPEGDILPGPHDVVLVTGGARGIVANCISSLGGKTAAAFIILGRSKPENDPELVRYVRDLSADDIRVRYMSVDLTDPAAVREAVKEAESEFGPVTAIVHGAGRNEPALLRDLDVAELRRTLDVKIQALRNLLAVVDPAGLRVLFSFGSVIGRIGLRGEAHYALANSCLAALTEEFGRQHPDCHCVVFESSAWSGAGMAERLGVLENLSRDGIAPISPDEGVNWFRKLLTSNLPSTSVVVSGRLGPVSPLPIAAPSIPLLRYLERPRVFYPGIELVADSELAIGSDPYLMDHVFQGQPLLPGVMGLEAMAQAAMAVAGKSCLPTFENVHFEQPVIVQPGTRVILRTAALVHDDGAVEVVLRSSETSFAVDHFRCFCRFNDAPTTESAVEIPHTRLSVDAPRDLYGTLLFQAGRFRRLSGYRELSALHAWAEIAPRADQAWFSAYLPSSLVLGDAGTRDAAIHSIQSCVPHGVLLPSAIERLQPGFLSSGETVLAYARERWQDGNTYCYDLELRCENGALIESWSGLKLHKVADASACALPDALVAVSLQRRVREMGAASQLRAVFERDHAVDRRSRSERAIQRALETTRPVQWRSDGKPEVDSEISVSAAHMNGLTLAVAAPGPVACDLEPVSARPDQVWRDLLGGHGWRLAELISSEAGEDMHTSATRVWTAIESLKKAGAPENSQLMLVNSPHKSNGLVSLKTGSMKIATAVVRFREDPLPAAVSILTGS